MTIAIYPGSFDPVTKGHIDVLTQASPIFEKIIVIIANNHTKNNFLPIEIRKSLIEESTKFLPNIIVDSYNGLTVEYATKHNASVIIRGLRNSADFDYELTLAHNNSVLDESIKTIFFPTKPEYSYISSSAVREILFNNGSIEPFVPSAVYKYFS